MTTATMTFNQMETRAERTLALVLWAKHAHRVVKGAMLVTLVSRAVRGLVNSLTPERLESLTQKQTIELTKRLQEVHEALVELCRAAEKVNLSQHPIWRSPIRSVEESTEDLGDIIEDLVLSENEQFRQMIADCAQPRPQTVTAGTLGRM
jgi:hypothetical protein